MSNEELSASKYFKRECGLTTKQVSEIAQVPYRTLENWFISRNRLVEIIVSGIKYEQAQHNELRRKLQIK